MVASGKQVVPLVEPDEGSDFPQCIGVPAAMVLRQGQQRFLLLRVKQKDTREDISLNDMLLLDAGGVPQARDDLSGTTAPDATQPLTQVAAWLRARWANQAEAEQGARALQEHTAIPASVWWPPRRTSKAPRRGLWSCCRHLATQAAERKLPRMLRAL
ncbi:hypothetical protein [Roseateles amylovorans]|uniref:Uncharacterized protein n=1 Tax=Roseateles amylovorans TaxID=2978473 RepID=A0ABY6B5R7_9BURK|nr:hypothetical protein [Roseateles amylovorans]UXH80096.1 hypothetical protein N4261_09525 [Roseateles amylovorans]